MAGPGGLRIRRCLEGHQQQTREAAKGRGTSTAQAGPVAFNSGPTRKSDLADESHRAPQLQPVHPMKKSSGFGQTLPGPCVAAMDPKLPPGTMDSPLSSWIGGGTVQIDFNFVSELGAPPIAD